VISLFFNNIPNQEAWALSVTEFFIVNGEAHDTDDDVGLKTKVISFSSRDTYSSSY
jgi:hypothetical protein